MTTEERFALRTPQGLRAWRREQGLTQADIADALEVDVMTVSRWERGLLDISRAVELALLWIDEHGAW